MRLVRSHASFGEALSVAWGSLRSSKLRGFLTLLGIILATATLIIVMSVINGMDVMIATQIQPKFARGQSAGPARPERGASIHACVAGLRPGVVRTQVRTGTLKRALQADS